MSDNGPVVPVPGTKGGNRNHFSFMHVSEIMAEPDEEFEWLIDEVLPVGGFALMTSAPKVGKSTAARALAVAVARGDRWLGRATQRGPVLYVAAEEHRGLVSSALRRLGVRDDDPIHFHFGAVPKQPEAALIRATEHYQPSLVIIDTMFRVLRNTEEGNEYGAMTRALERFVDLAREHNVGIMCLHHNRKSGGDNGDEVLGSTAIFGQCDSLISLRRDGKYGQVRYVRCTEQRAGRPIEEAVLHINERGWVSLGNTRAHEEKKTAADVVFDYLSAQSEPVNTTHIRKGVKLSNARVQEALEKLVKDGLVLFEKAGQQNLYSVAPDL